MGVATSLFEVAVGGLSAPTLLAGPVGGALFVWLDARELGLTRLWKARAPLTGFERLRPWEWGVIAVLFPMVFMPVYAVKRRTLWALANAADGTGQHASQRERRRADRTPGFYAPQAVRDRKRRNWMEVWTLVVAILLYVALSLVAFSLSLASLSQGAA